MKCALLTHPRFSNHWQWVVMLIVLVVAIAGIWVGACIWRRQYLKKKERQRTWAQKQSGSTNRPSWGPGDPRATEAGQAMGTRPPIGSTPPSDDPRTAGVFMPKAQQSAVPEVETEKPKKKRWGRKDQS